MVSALWSWHVQAKAKQDGKQDELEDLQTKLLGMQGATSSKHFTCNHITCNSVIHMQLHVSLPIHYVYILFIILFIYYIKSDDVTIRRIIHTSHCKD